MEEEDLVGDDERSEEKSQRWDVRAKFDEWVEDGQWIRESGRRDAESWRGDARFRLWGG